MSPKRAMQLGVLDGAVAIRIERLKERVHIRPRRVITESEHSSSQLALSDSEVAVAIPQTKQIENAHVLRRQRIAKLLLNGASVICSLLRCRQRRGLRLCDLALLKSGGCRRLRHNT